MALARLYRFVFAPAHSFNPLFILELDFWGQVQRSSVHSLLFSKKNFISCLASFYSLFYIMPSIPPLPIDAFPTWARFNDVDFVNANLQETDGKGIGLVAVQSILNRSVATEDEAHAKDLQHGKSEVSEKETAGGVVGVGTQRHDQDSNPLIRIPYELVLSTAAVEEYTKVDQNFRQLIDFVGHQVRL